MRSFSVGLRFAPYSRLARPKELGKRRAQTSISVLIGSQISGSPFPLQWLLCKHRICFQLKFSHLHKSLPADSSFCRCERVACNGAHELLSTDCFLRDNVRAFVRSLDRPLPPTVPHDSTHRLSLSSPTSTPCAAIVTLQHQPQSSEKYRVYWRLSRDDVEHDRSLIICT